MKESVFLYSGYLFYISNETNYDRIFIIIIHMMFDPSVLK